MLRWVKGYAFNPIGFVERPKDPNDPELAREGFVMADADFIWQREGALQTVAFTPVILPVGRDVNGDFGATGDVNPAAKLYLLYRDTDIDFAWQGKGSRPARFGMDFSRNIASNFEIHGEWARVQQFTKPVTDSTGRVTTVTTNVKKTEKEGFYSGEAGDFRISIDRTQNRSPRSIDLVLLGLGACTISTVDHYLNRKGLPPDSVEVELSADFEEKEGLYKNLKIVLKVDDRIPPEIRKVVAGIARSCRIHRTLEAASRISIELAENSGTTVS